MSEFDPNDLDDPDFDPAENLDYDMPERNGVPPELGSSIIRPSSTFTSSIANKLQGIPLKQVIRLTPATLAHHITEGQWVPAQHLIYVAGEIARAVRKGGARIIVQAPPRHGKSELISVHTPTWFLDEFPEGRVLLTSYNADLPAMFARRVRDTIAKFGGVVKGAAFQGLSSGRSALPSFEQPILNVKLRGDVRQVSQFQTHRGGGMFSVGIGGSITGRGADLLLVDDFVKNAEEAESASTLDAIWDWFISTAYTRLEPNASVIILATRWNIRDLIGRVMEYSKTSDKKWQVITLPALALPDDVLGRKPGEALWPARYPVSELLEKKAILGKYFWEALYQQNPIKKEDASASPEDIQYLDILPHPATIRHLRSWDTGATEGGGDPTVGFKWGMKGRVGENPSFYIQDIVRGQWGNTRMEKIMRDTALADGYNCPIVIEQEPGSSGKNYALYLAETVLKGFKVIIKPANTNKWLKAQPFLAALENRQVYAKRAPWNSDLENEILTFPGGLHDDIIDAGAIGFNELVASKYKSPLWGRNQGAERTLHNYITSTRGSNSVSGATFGRRR